MPLTELLPQYLIEPSTEKKRLLLEQAASKLPAPEALWYPMALQALDSGDVALCRTAMRLLAFAPQSWEQVLRVALATPDAGLQRAALAALATQAKAVPELLEAFSSLDSRPDWLPESRLVWQAALAKLNPGSPPFAPMPAELQTRLDEQAQQTAKLVVALENERRSTQSVAARLERLIAVRDDETTQWEKEQAEFERLRKRHKRVLGATITLAVLLVLAGGSAAWLLSSQKSAPQPPAVPALAPAVVPGEDLKAAEVTGYRRALQALADQAGQLEKSGKLELAAAAWQAYSKLATSPSEAQAGEKAQAAIMARLHPSPAPAARPPLAIPNQQTPGMLAPRAGSTGIVAPRTVARVAPVAPAPARVYHQAPRHHVVRQAPAPVQPATHLRRAVEAPPAAAPVEPPPEPGIPENVRAKF